VSRPPPRSAGADLARLADARGRNGRYPPDLDESSKADAGIPGRMADSECRPAKKGRVMRIAAGYGPRVNPLALAVGASLMWAVSVGCGGATIHKAAERGDLAGVQGFLAKGVPVNARDGVLGSTSLHWAAWMGHDDVVRLLVASGADVNAKNNLGLTPLHWAAQKGHRNAAELLVASGAVVDAKENGGSTPLHRAAWKGHEDVVRLLVASGADVNAKTKSGTTPVGFAAMKGHMDVVEFLKMSGASE